jgi:chemotaxis protein CheZ
MPVQRKVFRIEEMPRAPAPTIADPAAGMALQKQTRAELAMRRALIEHRSDTVPAGDDDGLDAERLRQLKGETDNIHHAISRTKDEIAALHASGFDGESNRVFRELDAVVGSAERAIQQILAAAEDIDEAANTLSATLRHEQERSLAQDIRDQVVRIFEACNFQDLAGQRITKVLATLKFIETRVARMMDIWGGIDAFQDHGATAAKTRDRGPALLNGPKLAGEPGHASQDEVDAMFSTR